MIFVQKIKKIPEFYMIIAPKIFISRILGACGPHAPVFYANADDNKLLATSTDHKSLMKPAESWLPSVLKPCVIACSRSELTPSPCKCRKYVRFSTWTQMLEMPASLNSAVTCASYQQQHHWHTAAYITYTATVMLNNLISYAVKST